MTILKPFQAFVQVIKCNSFSKAAHVLGISPSSITRQIKQLEDELGFSLLERTTRTLILTEAGLLFYEHCQEILSFYDASKKNLNHFHNALAGTIKIGVPTSLSYFYITHAIHEFLALYPHIKIQIVNGDHLFDLLEEGFDLIIHCRDLPDSNYYYTKLGSWVQRICASPAYIEKYGLPKTPTDLSKHNCLCHYENKTKRWALLIEGKIQDIHIDGNVAADSNIDLKNIIMKGVGIAYLPDFTVRHELASGTLQSLLNEYLLPHHNFYAVYSKNRLHTKKVKVFLDFLVEIFA